ncbi:MAG: hypothetical protein HYS17_06165 [Micavibrio aeruginosavorus]|uniref:OmpA-like domain-containing protein n=1 Tax=Micavibrio aeruginosavorus TaxID=349221 RepID=A0A7T5R0E6_9BACT|nr:MAG: hypothetical protein HYS17_06165 [Micavibrio aeruginosavorus]
MKNILLRAGALALMGVVTTTVMIQAAPAYARAGDRPPLIITNDPLPAELQDRVYSKPKRTRSIDPSEVSGDSYFNAGDVTVVGRKVDELRNELFNLQGKVSQLAESLSALEKDGQGKSAEYYAAVATISTQLQSGTTPGNPRLVSRLAEARSSLETLASNVASLNDLAMDISGAASMSSFLLESARATYSLSGAVEEDHVRLAQMEDAINNTVVVIDRMLDNVNDDITRTVSYLSTERENLRTMSLAVTTGSLFGKSLSTRPFSNATLAHFGNDTQMVASPAAYAPEGEPVPPQMAGIPGGPRPLVKIRFDRADVSYEQPMYVAVNEALTRYPNARFELVAVHPNSGNTAAVAIESTRARRNAERVLRTLTEMGLSLDRIDLSYSPSAEATTNEVHLYVR